MNSLKVVLRHDFFEFINDSQFYIKHDNIHIKFQYDTERCRLSVDLESNKESVTSLEEEYARLHLLFFLMIGSCPIIKSKALNDKECVVDELSVKYFTDRHYHNIHFRLCVPSSQNITESLIKSFKAITLPEKISLISFYSLQALVSQEYKNVFIDHKLTLLLQTLDGMIDIEQGFNKENIKCEIIKEWPDMERQEIGDLFYKIYFFASETIFCYENKCRILKVLGKNKKEFLDAIIHTRHFYSHMLSLNERRKRLTEGKDLRVYFEILVYSIRVYWLKKMNVKLDENVILNTYSVFHDWLVDINQLQNEAYLSGTYQLHQRLKEFKQQE